MEERSISFDATGQRRDRKEYFYEPGGVMLPNAYVQKVIEYKLIGELLMQILKTLFVHCTFFNSSFPGHSG
jgi:hypothetical protein